MQKGWIKIHRSIQDKGYYNKPAYVSLWFHLLLSANHQPKEVLWNGQLVTLKAGQFITGRKELSKTLGIPETTIERILKVLESGHQIGQQKTTKYRLITILNWDKFQCVDNKRTTNGQQTDTNKNVRKKEYNISGQSPEEAKELDMFNKYSDDYEEGVVDLDTGELTDSSVEKKKNEPNRKRMDELVNWLIDYQGRDKLKTNRPKQYKALKELVKMRVTGKEAQEVIKEAMQDPYWMGKKEKPDFSTAVAIIQKRG